MWCFDKGWKVIPGWQNWSPMCLIASLWFIIHVHSDFINYSRKPLNQLCSSRWLLPACASILGCSIWCFDKGWMVIPRWHNSSPTCLMTSHLLRISIFIRLSVECRESNHDILMSSQRSLHRKTVRNKRQNVLYCGPVDCSVLIIDIRYELSGMGLVSIQ